MLAAIFGLFYGLATVLGSDRGQAGLLIGGVVVLATVAAETVLFGRRPGGAALWLGLGRPAARGLTAGVGIGLLLLSVLPVAAALRGANLAWYPGWPTLLPGLFAQAGIAEEILFRGYLFRHVRVGRSFWRAAVLSMAPFTAVHLILFLTMPWPVALAAVALAAAVTPPMARLFELAGNTIWAPALLHFVMQGALKVVQVPGESGMLLPILWMAACAVLPYLVFVMRRPLEPPDTVPGQV